MFKSGSHFASARARCSWAALAALLTACSEPDDPANDPLASRHPALSIGDPGGGVHGSVRASYSALGGAVLLLPDVEVYLKNLLDGSVGAPVRTDLDGFYALPGQPQGFYNVCWRKPGYVEACSSTVLTVEEQTVFPGRSAIAPASEILLRGTVKLADDALCLHLDEFFGIEHTAQIELYASGGALLQSVRANQHGEFLLTGVPSTGEVVVRCGELSVVHSVRQGKFDLRGKTSHAFVLPNRLPQIRGIAAYEGSSANRVINALPGSVVRLEPDTHDPDGDALKLDWKVQDGLGHIVNLGGGVAEWTVPKTPGKHSAHLTAYDGRGGYDRRSVSVRVPDQDTSLVFSGVVKDVEGKPIEKALVDVGGLTTSSGERGEFSLSVPAGESYVLNISRPGYAEFSRRLQAPTRGRTFTLVEAFAQIIDPFSNSVVQDERKKWRDASFTDPRGEKRRYERRGGRVRIAANTLVDAQGNPPKPSAGPFTAYIATIDPVTETMLGDFSASNSDGKDVALFSFGALFIEVRDAAGQEYNLKPGATAEVEIPVQDPILSSENVPASIDTWSYGLKDGRWGELPVAGTFTGGSFKTQVTSFSTKNADVEKTEPACIRIQLDSGLPADGTYVARVDVTVSPGSVRRYELTLDNENNVLYNLPENAPYAIELFDGAPPGGVLVDTIPGNTGSPWGGVGTPPYPYAACATTFIDPADISAGVVFLTRKGVGSAGQAAAYYAAIDPLDRRETLGEFWAENGFDPLDGSGGVRTSFINHNDLGFGRDMHCRANGSDVACYVTNYGEPDQAPGNFDLASTANPADAVATVAMEYSAIEGAGATRVVKFYAYAGGSAGGALLDSADLDKSGPKFLPHLCLNCHGGDAGGSDLGASFREFDVYSFRDSSGSNPDVANGIADVLAQEPNFLLQNELVRDTNPAPAIVDLLNAFYDNGASSTVDPNAVPGPWQAGTTGNASTEDLYLDFVAKGCRTCHSAQAPSLDWNTYAEFALSRGIIYFDVCTGKAMPHANITFKNLWLSTSPHAPDVLGSYTGPGWAAPLGACLP